MSRRWIILAVAVLLVVSVTAPAAAQDPAWSLYLLNGRTNQLIRIFLDGTQQPVDLGLPADTYVGAASIDFSNGGSRAAYCVSTSQAGAGATLTIKDMTGTSAPVAVDLGKTDGCWVNFGEDGEQVAVGVVRHYAGDPNADASVPAWELLVFDATTGQSVAAMNPTKAAAIGFDPNRTIMPQVRYFANGQIVYAGVQWGTDGSPSSPAYFWQLSDDSLQSIDRWWRWGLDSLPATGELVWVELDSSLPAADPGGPLPQGNLVKLADKSGDAHTIYTDSSWVIMGTQFIDSGRELAISELQGFDPDNPMNSQSTRWIALARDGSIRELVTSLGFSQLVPAPDGYVYLRASDNSASPLLTLEYHSGGNSVQLWQQQTQGGMSWSILWSAPTPSASDLAAFPEVTP